MLATLGFLGHVFHAKKNEVCFETEDHPKSVICSGRIGLTPPSILKGKAQMAIEMEKQITYYQLI